MATPPAEQQLDLLGRIPPRSVHERCRAKHGDPEKACIIIWADEEMTEAIRTERCRDWCPLLNERIEIREEYPKCRAV